MSFFAGSKFFFLACVCEHSVVIFTSVQLKLKTLIWSDLFCSDPGGRFQTCFRKILRIDSKLSSISKMKNRQNCHKVFQNMILGKYLQEASWRTMLLTRSDSGIFFSLYSPLMLGFTIDGWSWFLMAAKLYSAGKILKVRLNQSATALIWRGCLED